MTANAPINQAIENFLEHLAVMRGLSPHTVAAYGRDLRAFFTQVKHSPGEVTPAIIEKYLLHVGKGNNRLAASSQARRLAALRSFFAHASDVKDNPAAAVSRPKQAEKLPKALSETQMNQLLDSPIGATPPELRLKLILQLLYACGLRVSELAGLTLADVAEGDGQVLRVTGKGGKTRLVPLGGVAYETLQTYLQNARPHLPGTQSDYIFAGPGGKNPLTRQRLFQLVQEAGARVGVKVHPHQLRHTFATHLVNHDADLRAVQLMLGHASLNTTQVYTKVADQRVREVLERFHPLSKGK